jgi:signal transduction histidine kinase
MAKLKLSGKKSSKRTTGPRPAELAVLQRRLQRETVRRMAAEEAVRKSRLHYGQILAQSRLMQEQLKHLSHQILMVQEEERKYISRELHDEISQILAAINVRLAALKIEAASNTGNLQKNIDTTQHLVEKSVAAVHRFARELRPAILDDLGLVPTLLAFFKDLGKRTGLRISFTAVTAVKIEKLDSVKRTVLYRVAQEALTNVSRHARASLAMVSILMQTDAVCMTVSDNGMSFDVDAALAPRQRKRLGIIGMRERVEMIGGVFGIQSAAGSGTTVSVRIPLRNGARKKA